MKLLARLLCWLKGHAERTTQTTEGTVRVGRHRVAAAWRYDRTCERCGKHLSTTYRQAESTLEHGVTPCP